MRSKILMTLAIVLATSLSFSTRAASWDAPTLPGGVKSLLLNQALESSGSYNTLAINDTLAKRMKTRSTQIKLPLQLLNSSTITALQFDMYLPNGISVAKESGKIMIELASRAPQNKFTVVSALQNDGALRVVVYSSSNATFSGNSGSILYFTMNVADTVADGSYSIQIKNIVLSDVNAVEETIPQVSSTLNVSSYIIGDVDNSGEVNIADAVCIINKILGRSTSTFEEKAADIDGDGIININDAVTLINNYILTTSTSSAKAHYSTSTTSGNADIEAAPLNINAGEEKTMNIALNNPSDAITAFQFDVNLPKGFSIVKDADGNYSQLAEGRNISATHQLGSNMLQNGDLRIACFSADNAVVAEQNGAVASIRIKADADVSAGTYYLTLHNAVLAHPDGLNAITPAEQKIAINVGTTGIENAENNGLQITSGKGIITLNTSTMQAVQIASINGMRIAAFTLQAEEGRTLKVAAGMYIVNGEKVVVE